MLVRQEPPVAKNCGVPAGPLSETGIEAAVGSIGDSYDNALTEPVIGLFKTDVIRLGP